MRTVANGFDNRNKMLGKQIKERKLAPSNRFTEMDAASPDALQPPAGRSTQILMYAAFPSKTIWPLVEVRIAR